ncbi:hypothetical protein D9611_005843 [Ephemerocybe angulata]|uniref:Uncharacterized protein n=1 Tax=Ephemerocybe angulata TaxID=980116 RepID=A0A8H5CH22_9AGAR|nr:hypothetical protein D9611_005843 [Tulosesus angulatus]
MAARPSQYSATRFEQLLGGVEAGSLRDYNKLMQEWPTDITLAHRIQALTVALAQLELRSAPVPDDAPTPNTEPREDPHRAKIQAIHILSVACNGTEHLTDEGKTQVYSILQRNLDGLISWLTFFAEAPYAQLATNERVGRVYLAVSRLAMVFAQLLVLGLKNEPETLLAERVVHSALDLWTTDPFEAEWLEAETPLLTRAGYEGSIHPVLHLFWFCTDEESLREILLEKIKDSWKKSWQKRFAKSFTFRCRQWEMVFKQGGQEANSSSTRQGAWGLFIIYRMAELLRGSHVLQRRLIQDQFSATVLKLALDFSDKLSQPGEVSLAVTVASEIFPLVNPTAQEVLKVVPELIKAGLLNIIIHDCSLRSASDCSPSTNGATTL